MGNVIQRKRLNLKCVSVIGDVKEAEEEDSKNTLFPLVMPLFAKCVST